MGEGNILKTLCFIDTNIWLYALIESDDDEKRTRSKRIIEGHEIAISTQVMNEVCVNLIQKAQFPETQIRELITDFYHKYLIIDVHKDILLKASELREQHQFSFWDSTIVASALQSGATILYSEDMQDGFVVESILTIRNPFLSQ